jgi:homoserine kinase
VARVRAPATVGNFGPGFDAFALALHDLGDDIELRPADEDSVEVIGADSIPRAWRRNVACAALDAAREAADVKSKFALTIHKSMPPGSGLGSSASSAGGAVLAFHALHGTLTPEQLVLAAGEGEAVAAGRHYDDVAAVILGGLAIVRSGHGRRLHLSRVQPPEGLHIAVVLPLKSFPTKEMRRILPKNFSREDAVANLGNAAAMVAAFQEGDIEAIGDCLDDRIATPARSTKMPWFEDVREAAICAGGLGVALSGSGPAMISVASSRRSATAIASAMQGAVEGHKVEAQSFPAEPEREVMHRAVALR